MSKYNALWVYVQKCAKPQIIMNFDEIDKIAGVSIDHSFLKYKKELCSYGYQVQKILLKEQKIVFVRIET